MTTYSDSRGWDITSVQSPYWSGTGISRDIDFKSDWRIIFLDEGEPKTWVRINSKCGGYCRGH